MHFSKRAGAHPNLNAWTMKLQKNYKISCRKKTFRFNMSHQTANVVMRPNEPSAHSRTTLSPHYALWTKTSLFSYGIHSYHKRNCVSICYADPGSTHAYRLGNSYMTSTASTHTRSPHLVFVSSCMKNPASADHGVDGFYLGPALQHYRCYRGWVVKTQCERVVDTVAWHLQTIVMPCASEKELLTKALVDLRTAIHESTFQLPLSETKSLTALYQQLAKFFPTPLSSRLPSPIAQILPQIYDATRRLRPPISVPQSTLALLIHFTLSFKFSVRIFYVINQFALEFASFMEHLNAFKYNPTKKNDISLVSKLFYICRYDIFSDFHFSQR